MRRILLLVYGTTLAAGCAETTPNAYVATPVNTQPQQVGPAPVYVTATPRHNGGAIFVQTVSDYPLVEAIHQNVVKHPVLPDAPSLARLQPDPRRRRQPRER